MGRKVGYIPLTLPADIKSQLKLEAKEQCRSMHSLCVYIITRYFRDSEEIPRGYREVHIEPPKPAQITKPTTAFDIEMQTAIDGAKAFGFSEELAKEMINKHGAVKVSNVMADILATEKEISAVQLVKELTKTTKQVTSLEAAYIEGLEKILSEGGSISQADYDRLPQDRQAQLIYSFTDIMGGEILYYDPITYQGPAQ